MYFISIYRLVVLIAVLHEAMNYEKYISDTIFRNFVKYTIPDSSGLYLR